MTIFRRKGGGGLGRVKKILIKKTEMVKKGGGGRGLSLLTQSKKKSFFLTPPLIVCNLLVWNFCNLLLLIIFLQNIPLVNFLTSDRWPRSVWSIEQWTIDIYHFLLKQRCWMELNSVAVCIIEAKEMNSVFSQTSDRHPLTERNEWDRSESTENVNLY